MRWQELLKKRLSLFLVAGFVLMTASASYATTLRVNTRSSVNATGASATVEGWWKLSGYDTWYKGGATSAAQNISTAGSYTIVFGNIPGYAKPADFTLTMINGTTNVVNAQGTVRAPNGYVADTEGNPGGFVAGIYPLTVNTTTGGYSGTSGTWSLDGGLSWHSNGATVSAPKVYKIKFESAATGWRAPHTITGDFLNAASRAANGVTGSGTAAVPYVISRPYTPIANDYDLNGRSDVMFRSVSTDLLYVWDMNATGLVTDATYFSNDSIRTPAAAEKIIAQADFNGDGRADLLFQNQTTRNLTVWIMGGKVGGGTPHGTDTWGHVSQSHAITYTLGASTFVGGAGDFNGNGLADILVVDYSDATKMVPSILTMTKDNFVQAAGLTNYFIAGAIVPTATPLTKLVGGAALTIPTTATTAYTATTGWHVAAIADLNGDGNSDILWRSMNSGVASVWNMKAAVRQSMGNLPTALGAYNNTIGSGATSAGWHIGGTGDFNSDGYTDLLVRNGAVGSVAVWLLKGQPTGAVLSKIADGVATAPFTPVCVPPASSCGDTTRGSGGVVDSEGTPIKVLSRSVGQGWQVAGIGEFGSSASTTKDTSSDDVLWRYLGTGHTYVWWMHGRTVGSYGFTSVYPGRLSTWQIPVMGNHPESH